MFDYFTAATGVVVLLCSFYAFQQTRDAFHPAVFTAPLFVYFYCLWPLQINFNDDLLDFFSFSDLGYVSGLYFFSITALYLGMLNRSRVFLRSVKKEKLGRSNIFAINLTRKDRKKIFSVATFLAFVAVSSYLYSIFNVGGFIDAYGQVKGGGRAASGYIGEAVLLAFPAILLLAISRQGRMLRVDDIVLALIFASPHLIQGTLGGRRGPLFLILSTLFIAYFIAKGVRPSLRKVFVGVGVISFAVLLVWSQRQDVYVGSAGEFEFSRVMEKLEAESLGPGNEYVVGVATVLMADHAEKFYWGYRYFVTFFIRPIPKQIWPTKYEDMGADWLYRYGDEERAARYFAAVGFVPLSGSSFGYIADAYQEFYWGVIPFSFLLGWFMGWLWEHHRLQGTIWSALFFEVLILSIYLPTQSVTASLQRFMFMALVTLLVWRFWFGSKSKFKNSQ